MDLEQESKKTEERPFIFPLGSRRFGLAGLVIGFLLALGVRIPWLWEIPRFIDELREVNLAYLISRGQALPLHNAAHDIGALHNYILAGIFDIFGTGIYLPRLYTAVTSAMTVIFIYLSGSRLYGRVAGVVAAGLLLTNGMHILVTHMAWANCTTPFFFTFALYTTIRAAEQPSGGWLVGAGCSWALALQTHPSIIIFLPVVLFYIARTPGLQPLFSRRSGVSVRYHYLAVLAFAAGYSNMLIYNLVSRGGSIRWAMQKGYTLEQSPGPVSFVHNLIQMWVELIRTIGSVYQTKSGMLEYLAYPAFSAGLFMLGYGIYRAVRCRRALPVWMLLAGCTVIPWINGRYGYYIATRYIMPLVICALLLIGCAANDLWKLQQRWLSRRWRPIHFAGSVLALGAIILWQQGLFYDYCRRLADTDMSNRMALQIVEQTRQMAGLDRRGLRVNRRIEILIDDRVHIPNDPLPVLYRLAGLPYTVLFHSSGESDSALRIRWLGKLGSNPGIRRIMVLDEQTYRKLREFIPDARVVRFETRKVLHGTHGQIRTTVFLASRVSD